MNSINLYLYIFIFPKIKFIYKIQINIPEINIKTNYINSMKYNIIKLIFLFEGFIHYFIFEFIIGKNAFVKIIYFIIITFYSFT